MLKSLIKKNISKGKALITGRQESIISAAFAMMVLLAITKVAGFVKIHLFARLFGASRELDIFWAAFTIPDLIFAVVVGGSINAALIPSFAEMLGGKGSKGEERMQLLFSRIVNVFAVIFVVLGAAVFILAPKICKFMVSNDLGNFGFDPKDFTQGNINQMAQLMRIMVISPVILSISGVLTAGIQVNKRFIIPAIAPLFYNLGIIVGGVVFSEVMNMGVVGLAWGVVLGSVLHLLVQLPMALRMGLRIHPLAGFWGKGVAKVVRLAVPRVFGLIGEQINVLVNTVISMGLIEGSLSAYKFGSSLHLLPVQLLAATISQAALPTLSLEYQGRSKDSGRSGEGSDEKLKIFNRIFLKSLQQILFLILPSVVFILVLRLPIVRLVLGAGEFDWEDTVITSWVLALFCVSIVGQSIISLVVRAYFAMHDTVVPVVVSFIGVIINIVGSIYLTNFFSHYYDWRDFIDAVFNRPEGFMSEFWQDLARWLTTRNSSIAAVGGLALSTGIALMIEVIILLFILNRRLKILSWKDFWQPLIKKILASGIMFSVMYFLFKLWNFNIDTSTVISIVGLFVGVGGVGVVVYFATCFAIDIGEVNFFVELAKKGIFRIRNLSLNGSIVKND
ncbi:murein biosynthesis integral membrane protein MurJ [Candidatus Dojkabacteria bacterium]|nr:murein biosynthesis integral membrane protein MurJ [Candidatus Dojkabacteria bacterium]